VPGLTTAWSLGSLGAEVLRGRVAVTRDVDPSAVGDLGGRPPRATLAFVASDVAEALPVAARLVDGVHRVGVPARDAADLHGREVVLVVDDGPYWFQLRGLSVRGTARRAAGADGGLVWFAIEPRRVLAWDFGRIRET